MEDASERTEKAEQEANSARSPGMANKAHLLCGLLRAVSNTMSPLNLGVFVAEAVSVARRFLLARAPRGFLPTLYAGEAHLGLRKDR